MGRNGSTNLPGPLGKSDPRYGKALGVLTAHRNVSGEWQELSLVTVRELVCSYSLHLLPSDSKRAFVPGLTVLGWLLFCEDGVLGFRAPPRGPCGCRHRAGGRLCSRVGRGWKRRLQPCVAGETGASHDHGHGDGGGGWCFHMSCFWALFLSPCSCTRGQQPIAPPFSSITLASSCNSFPSCPEGEEVNSHFSIQSSCRFSSRWLALQLQAPFKVP
jgi:hypothetical protein